MAIDDIILEGGPCPGKQPMKDHAKYLTLDEVIVTLPDSFLSAALDSRASVGTSNAIE